VTSFRRIISARTTVGVAVIALSLIASAPAATNRPASTRLFLADAQTRAIDVVDRGRGLAVPHLGGSVQASDSVHLTSTGFETTKSGSARVVIESNRPEDARAAVLTMDGRVERTWRNLVQATVPRTKLSALSRHASVDVVRAPFSYIEHAVAGEGVQASFATAWHAKGFTGKGAKVAVIDGGFEGLPELQAAGELPTNMITQDYCGGEFATASKHGAAVAEIVHEMAPDAQLYLICVGSEVDLAAAAGFAKSQGVHIVNQSLGWQGPYRDDGGGPVGAIVADARASGILWVNSAGNDADTHWSGTYNPSGTFHVWGGNGDQGNTFVWPNGTEICVFLKWDEWPAGVSDFDIALFLSGSNTMLAASAGDQTGSQPPFEGGCLAQESGTDLVVFWAIRGYRVTTSPRLDLWSWSPSLQYAVAAGSVGTPASSPSAFTVGALCWQSRQLEFYSSQGPTIDGRVKPDIAGHDSVSGMSLGAFSSCPSAFAGTSASSPEVAGAAALVKGAYPAYGPSELQQYLMRNARDIEPAGVDNATGAGELRLPTPPDVVSPTGKAVASSGRAGRTVKLVSRVGDDSGELRLVGQVKRNGRVIANLRKGYVHASGTVSVVLAWKAPASGARGYQHCVRVFDRAGNSSAASCAKVLLK
jgi:subtilisin family serine protease